MKGGLFESYVTRANNVMVVCENGRAATQSRIEIDSFTRADSRSAQLSCLNPPRSCASTRSTALLVSPSVSSKNYLTRRGTFPCGRAPAHFPFGESACTRNLFSYSRSLN